MEITSMRPELICVRKSKLLQRGYDNLKEWLVANRRHVYIGRNLNYYLNNPNITSRKVKNKVGGRSQRRIQRALFMAGKFQNPFRISENLTRQESLMKYKVYAKKYLLSDLRLLSGKILGCWCDNEPCHGEILQDIYTRYYDT